VAKGQRRSNREAKKPKQPKSEKKTAVPLTLLAPERGLARAQKGRELPRHSVPRLDSDPAWGAPSSLTDPAVMRVSKRLVEN